MCVQVFYFPNRNTWYELQFVCSSFLEGGRTEKHSLSSCPSKYKTQIHEYCKLLMYHILILHDIENLSINAVWYIKIYIWKYELSWDIFMQLQISVIPTIHIVLLWYIYIYVLYHLRVTWFMECVHGSLEGAIWPSLSPCTVINPILLTHGR